MEKVTHGRPTSGARVLFTGLTARGNLVQLLWKVSFLISLSPVLGPMSTVGALLDKVKGVD
jgi:hypothetical protein